MVLEKIKNFIKRNYFFYYFLKYIFYLSYKITPAKVRIKYLWKKKKGYKLCLNNPKTFNEKIQWLKLYYRNPLIKVCSNKLTVRDYVKGKIGKDFLNDILGVYDRFEDINFKDLPEKFVIKCNHDSGSAKIIYNKYTIDTKKLKYYFNFCLKVNYFHMSKEWGYDGLERKIIIEKLIETNNQEEIKDYKVFCFNGKPKLIQVDIDRHTNHKRNIYDCEWNWIDLSILYPKDKNLIEPKPFLLEKMLDLSAKLSEPFPHVRVDWYISGDKLILGEMTFYHGGGYEPFDNFDWELQMGEWIKLPGLKTKL